MTMDNLIVFPDQRRAREDASLWVARLDRGLSAIERDALNQWLAASPVHRDALVQMAEHWDNMSVLSELAALFPLGRAPRTLAWTPVTWALASSVAAVAVVSLAWLIGASRDYWSAPTAELPVVTANQVFETAVGEQSSALLSDGTLVTLNTDTLIEVRYSDTDRTVYLRRGEGYFSVVNGADRPFRVYTGGRVVQAVGTAFNVELAADDGVEVTVTEGTVVVDRFMDEQSASLKTGVQDPPTTVRAGEIAFVNDQHSRIDRLEPQDIEIQLAWQRGMIVFQGEPLEDVLAEVGRYTTVDFSVADDAIRSVRVGGYFRVGDVDGLLLALRENFQIDSQPIGNDEILLTAR